MDIVARAKNMIMAPQEEWRAVASEATDIPTIFMSYVLPLAAIPAAANFIFMLEFIRLFGFGHAIASAITAYILSIVGVGIFAFVAAKVAPSFGGRDSLTDGTKLAAYGATAGWVGSIFIIIPLIGWIAALAAGIYTLYLIYIGIEPTMTVPAERRGIYALIVIVVAIVIRVLIGVLARNI
jgi:hypothetical protein